jgi:hypothetical protein
LVPQKIGTIHGIATSL